jgi:hypothetical protein
MMIMTKRNKGVMIKLYYFHLSRIASVQTM